MNGISNGLHRTRAIFLLCSLMLIALGCSSTSTRTDPKGLPAKITVTASEWKVAAPPVAAGTPITLHVENAGKVPHQIVVEAAGKTYTTEMLLPNLTDDISLPALTAGAYKMYCSVAGHRQTGMETTLVVGTPGNASVVSPAQMDQMMADNMKAFPAKTQGTGNQPLAPSIVNGVKVFDITAAATKWETAPGQFVDAYAFNGMIPGPQLHASTGDRVRVVLHNNLPESTAVHFHGMTVPNAMDGVPFITQQPVKPGATFTYEFTIKDKPGTYMYHSHYNALFQMGHGLFGSFVIDDPHPKWDVDETVFLSDGPLGFAINGKGFPATHPIIVKKDKRVLLRFLNAGEFLHPMHLHGFHFRVLAEDGYALAQPYEVDTLVIAPGQRFDAVFVADQLGVWAFHCHILSHAENDQGMFGMVTAVIVQ